MSVELKEYCRLLIREINKSVEKSLCWRETGENAYAVAIPSVGDILNHDIQF